MDAAVFSLLEPLWSESIANRHRCPWYILLTLHSVSDRVLWCCHSAANDNQGSELQGLLLFLIKIGGGTGERSTNLYIRNENEYTCFDSMRTIKMRCTVYVQMAANTDGQTIAEILHSWSKTTHQADTITLPPHHAASLLHGHLLLIEPEPTQRVIQIQDHILRRFL